MFRRRTTLMYLAFVACTVLMIAVSIAPLMAQSDRFMTGEWARWDTNQLIKVLAGDFDGDGDTDVMKFDVPASGTSENGLWVGLSDPDSRKFIANEWARWHTNQQIKVLAGDFDGDGDTDVMKIDVPESGTSENGLWVGLSDPDTKTFVTTEWAKWETNQQMKVLAGDFDGDGDTDVMKFDVPASGTSENGLWVGLSDPGTKKFVSAEWARWHTNQQIKVLAGDFDGDGATDVMKIDVPESGTSSNGLWVGLSDPGNTRFITSRWAMWNTNQIIKVLTGDFDGDGNSDVMKFDVPWSGTSQNGLWVGLSVKPGIVFTKTVSADSAGCANTETITLPVGGGVVTYCYTVENSGNITLTLHDLEDSELGVLLDDYTVTLGLGEDFWLTKTTSVTSTTVNTATWTAFNAGPTDVVSDTDIATVNITPPSITPPSMVYLPIVLKSFSPP